MGERERPKTQVRRRVRNGAQAILDRVNGLLHGDIPDVEFLEEGGKEEYDFRARDLKAPQLRWGGSGGTEDPPVLQ